LEMGEPKSKRLSLHGQDTERGGIMIGFRPACVRSDGGAAARVGRRLWAWQGDLPGAGFWKMLHLAITIS